LEYGDTNRGKREGETEKKTREYLFGLGYQTRRARNGLKWRKRKWEGSQEGKREGSLGLDVPLESINGEPRSQRIELTGQLNKVRSGGGEKTKKRKGAKARGKKKEAGGENQNKTQTEYKFTRTTKKGSKIIPAP